MKISVITPTHNRKEMLIEAIQSVQASVFDPASNVSFEHIIYDDASTDGTEELFKKNTWANVLYFRNEERKGQSFCRNRAVDKASGDYVFILDDDDLVLKRTLSNFATAATQNPETQWFFGEFIIVNKERSYFIGQDYVGHTYHNPKEWLEMILEDKDFLPSSILIKKELYTEVGGFDETLSITDDTDLNIRFLLKNAMPLHCTFISHIRRLHNSNISAGIVHRQYREPLKKKYAKQLTEFGIKV